MKAERDAALDILWRDIDDLRDPKLSLVQVAAKTSNGKFWLKQSLSKAEAERDRLLEELEELSGKRV